MSLDRLSRLLTVGIVLMCSGSLFTTWLADRNYRHAIQTEQERDAVADLTATLFEGNQRLTQLARQFMATGDAMFLRAHTGESDQRQTFEKAVERLLSMNLLDKERALLEDIKRINAAQGLVEVEAMRTRTQAKPMEMLDDTPYIASEARISDLIGQLRKSANSRLDQQVLVTREYARLAHLLSLGMQVLWLIALITGIFLLRYRLVRPLLSLTRQTRNLQLGLPLQRIASPCALSEIRNLAKAMDDYRAVNRQAEQRAWGDRCLSELGVALQERVTREDFAAELGQQLGAMLLCSDVRLLPTPVTDDDTHPERVLLPLSHANQELAVLELTFSTPCGPEQQMLMQRLAPALGQLLAIQQQREYQKQLLTNLEDRQLTLTATENWYRGIIQAAPDALMVFDESGCVTLANAEGEQIFGYRQDELQGRHFKTLVPRDQWKALAMMLEVYLRTRQNLRQDSIALRRDGSEFPIEIRLSDLPSLDGRGRSLCVVVRDMTQSRAQELSLTRAHEHRQAMFNSAPHGIAFVRDGLIIQANPRLHELFGQQADALIGTSPTSWAHPDNLAALEQEIRWQLAHGEIFHRELPVYRPDGSHFFAAISARAVKSRDLREGSIWIVEDASLQYAARLEMAEARQLAEEAAQLKADFLANMSHEIRTPMNAIIGMTHLLSQTTLDVQQRDYLSKVQGANRHLLGVINDILDFSKIEAGKMELDIQDFSLHRLLLEVTDQVRPDIERKGLDLFVEIDESLPERLSGDPLRLRQILLNYLSNAVKFTEQGHVEVRVDGSPQPEERLLVRFRVSDTGIGMSPDQCSRAFQSFRQADATTTRRYGGTGLGLAIARQLSELMGGGVGISSTPDVGSCFSFTANLTEATSSPEEEESRQALAIPQFIGAHILLVEDNELNQQVASELLSATGCHVDIADNGQIALKRLEEQPYHLVLMDMQMPVLDGVGCCLQLRRRDSWKNLPVIAMTANALKSDREKCLAAGMNDFISKPLEPSVLFDVLRRWLAEYLSTPAGAAPVETTVQLDLEALGQAGLNTGAALYRMLGKQALYETLLRKYVATQPALLDGLQQALDGGDQRQARLLAHSCKGASANIGAEAVAELAAALEQSIAAEADPAQASSQLDRLARTLGTLLASLARCLPDEPAPPTSTELDLSELPIIAGRLDDLLGDHDATVISLFQEHRALFNAACRVRGRLLDTALSCFDFEQARENLKAFMAPPQPST